jgi:hypothetical protein
MRLHECGGATVSNLRFAGANVMTRTTFDCQSLVVTAEFLFAAAAKNQFVFFST